VASEKALDPREAIKELGSLVEQVQELWRDGSSWSTEEKIDRRRQLVTTYVRVFAPAVAFSAVQLSLSFGVLAIILLALQLTNHGYADLEAWTQAIPPLHGAVEKLDPALGNGAIALLAVELLGPAIIAIALLAAPPATQALQQRLKAAGLDADGLNDRIEAVLEATGD